MPVKRINTVVILFPNQEWNSAAMETQPKGAVSQLLPNISFTQQVEREKIQTLLTHNADWRKEINGFLYTPDLHRSDLCFNTSAGYMASNVTRQSNLPPTDFTLIGIVPWISIECTKSYLSSARMAPVRALLVYHPNDGTSQPPPVSSPSWGLDDGGAWKSQTPFPVYAISSDMGTQLIRQSSLYSGNMTDVPHGHEISEMAGGDSRDYVRLYTKISMSNDTGWPGVWAFVLVIVAALVIMLVITSATMHFLLRCQRYFLRLRVANGEVNLEALGIVRLTVSEEGIKKLPLFIYRCETTPSSPIPIDPKREYQNTREQYGSSDDFVTIPGPSDVLRINPTLVSRYSDAGDSLLNDGANNFRSGSQPTCAICLDDFVSGSTPVRELPCEHIFHPECIDSFLGNHSSLCPMCKKSVLPAGYCPVVITNAMVRRERNIRALRSRINLSEDPRRGEVSRPIFQTISIQLRRIISQPFSIQQENRSNMSLQPQIVLTAMRSLGEVGRHDSILSHDAPQNIPHTLNRQEFAQQRIRGLTAMQIFVDEPEITRTRQQPKWRETLVKAFPGFS